MILDQFGNSIEQPKPQAVIVRKRNYDAANNDRHTQKHFLTADNRDADSLIAVSLETLRNRVRYEIRNNSYAAGIVDTKANDIVGIGPQLQFTAGSEAFNNDVESKFAQWCADCDIQGLQSWADILKLAASRGQDSCGEGIIVLVFDNRNGIRGPRLRLQTVEPDRLHTPFSLAGASEIRGDGKINQGISFDEYGRPSLYYISKKHPGSDSSTYGLTPSDYDMIPADRIIHLYRMDRPGQSRGVPWLTPAILLFASLRRYTAATVDAAETAANFAAVIKSTGGLTEDAADLEEMETFDIERNMLTTLPIGWEMQQYKPEQPTSTYAEFKAEILNEIARCLNMPYNVAAGNSQKYNYASGRLDWQNYFRFISTTQAWVERQVCNRIFRRWLAEAMLIPGYLLSPGKAIDLTDANIKWYWPGQEHVDPQKEANAQKTRLEIGTTTLAAEFSRQGKDWEKELEQRAREQKKMVELGLKFGSPQNTQGANNEPQKDEIDDEDEDEEDNKGERSIRPRLIAVR